MDTKIRDFFEFIRALFCLFFFVAVPGYVVYKSWGELDGLLAAAGLAGFTTLAALIPYLVIRVILFCVESWIIDLFDD